MPVVVRCWNSYFKKCRRHRLHARQCGADHTGALVGSSGDPVLHHKVAGTNRSPPVILGGFGGETSGSQWHSRDALPVKQGSAEDAPTSAEECKQKVTIVPGYGNSEWREESHAPREMADKLKEEGVEREIRDPSGRAACQAHERATRRSQRCPTTKCLSSKTSTSEFAQADVAFVIGANDVTNPSAKTDPKSPIFGMPVLDVEKAKTVLFIKRGMGSGYAGVENELFFKDNTMMLFADAKKMVENIVKAL
ncbi:MAG: NAD(P)(+) transhydrogenase (Re/Si-specific) subunit beta [Xanthobacteraceae bacterium]|nr:NAD(P)(+) transhydrogenase (Re/Si-specific) subunit beta [Xanthobacteraceae bacterium]